MTDKAKKPSQFVELQINKEPVTHQELKDESCCGSCSGKGDCKNNGDKEHHHHA